MKASSALLIVKLVHTVAWAFFASCVLLIPLAAYLERLDTAAILIGIVVIEIGIFVLNRWRCPLTAVAARYTQDREDNFDIFLPVWLARYNKTIFSALFLFGVAYTVFKWWHP